jgi:hypothetical protein
MKAARYEELLKVRAAHCEMRTVTELCALRLDMGLAPGGRMRQEIYSDPYGQEAWDQGAGNGSAKPTATNWRRRQGPFRGR